MPPRIRSDLPQTTAHCSVNREQRRVNRHVKDARGQAQPGSENPRSCPNPAHPGVVNRFGRQSLESSPIMKAGDGTENRKKQQDENAMAITRNRR